MGYSSDLTDKEWEIIEPLLLSQKKKTRPPLWTKRQPDGATGRLKTRQGCDSRQIAGKKIG